MSYFSNFAPEFFTSFVVELSHVYLAGEAVRPPTCNFVKHLFDVFIFSEVEEERARVKD